MGKLPIITIFFFLLCFNSKAQVNFSEQYDTLYYKSGMVRPCLIKKIEYPFIHFTSINSKGVTVSSSISINKLKYYVDYDEMGKNRINPTENVNGEIKIPKPRTDSLWVYQHHLSVNPFSPFLLGLNTSYMLRTGINMEYGIHIPFRLYTFYGNLIFIQAGIGLNYFPLKEQNHSIYVGITSQFYFVEGYQFFGLPLTLGYIKTLSERITFHCYFGAGPLIGKEFKSSSVAFKLPFVVDGHVGIGFNLGEKYLTNTQAKKQ